jgi:hypothetical protein
LGSFERHSVAMRRRPSQVVHLSSRRPTNTDRQPTLMDPKAGQIVRGLMYGAPIGLGMWMMLGLLVWKIV